VKKIYDAVITTGEYTDSQGNKKKRFLTVGAVFEGDKGPSMKLEALPVAGFNGWINFYAPRERAEQKPAQPQSAGDEPAFNDDIPF
jgi:hypothetical protein